MSQVRPGKTIYLRGGTFYKHVRVAVRGNRRKPITIRSYPGELAVIDGGLTGFFHSPEFAWDPDGAAGEFRSRRSYPDLGGRSFDQCAWQLC